LERKIRSKQAQLIQENGRNVSFSRTLEIMIKKYLESNEVGSPHNYMRLGMGENTSDWR